MTSIYDSPSLFSSSPPLTTFDRIFFFHGFDLEEPLHLLNLSVRVCMTSSGRRVHGIPYSLALIACGIIADNRYANTYLARRPDREGPLEAIAHEENGGVLAGGQSLYFVSDSGSGTCEDYPLVLDFREWRFPRDQLPDMWSEATIPGCIASSEECIITADTDALQKAYIVPRAERVWFADNHMYLYVRNDQPGIDSPSNMVTLRADLHAMFDANRFLLLPAALTGGGRLPADGRAPVEVERAEWRTWEFTSGKTIRFQEDYHNRATALPVKGVSKEFLFARFAWSILGSAMVGQELYVPKGGVPIMTKSGVKRAFGAVSEGSEGPFIPRGKRTKSGKSAVEVNQVVGAVQHLLEEEGVEMEELVKYWPLREAEEGDVEPEDEVEEVAPEGAVVATGARIGEGR